MNIFENDVLGHLTRPGLGSLTMAVWQWEAENLLAAQSMSLEVWAVPLTCERPGGFLESCRASIYFRRLTKPVLIAKESCRSRINGLVSESEDKQVKSKASPLPVLSSALLLQVPPTFRLGLPASNHVIKEVPHRGGQWLAVWVDSGSRQVDNRN